MVTQEVQCRNSDLDAPIRVLLAAPCITHSSTKKEIQQPGITVNRAIFTVQQTKSLLVMPACPRISTLSHGCFLLTTAHICGPDTHTGDPTELLAPGFGPALPKQLSQPADGKSLCLSSNSTFQISK